MRAGRAAPWLVSAALVALAGCGASHSRGPSARTVRPEPLTTVRPLLAPLASAERADAAVVQAIDGREVVRASEESLRLQGAGRRVVDLASGARTGALADAARSYGERIVLMGTDYDRVIAAVSGNENSDLARAVADVREDRRTVENQGRRLLAASPPGADRRRLAHHVAAVGARRPIAVRGR